MTHDNHIINQWPIRHIAETIHHLDPLSRHHLQDVLEKEMLNSKCFAHAMATAAARAVEERQRQG